MQNPNQQFPLLPDSWISAHPWMRGHTAEFCTPGVPCGASPLQVLWGGKDEKDEKPRGLGWGQGEVGGVPSCRGTPGLSGIQQHSEVKDEGM